MRTLVHLWDAPGAELATWPTAIFAVWLELRRFPQILVLLHLYILLTQRRLRLFSVYFWLRSDLKH